MMVPNYAPIVRIILIALVAVAVLATAAGYGINTCQRHQLTTQSAAIEAKRAAAIMPDQQARRAADSAYFFTQGRRYEVARLDSLAAHAPATPALPAISALPHGQ